MQLLETSEKFALQRVKGTAVKNLKMTALERRREARESAAFQKTIRERTGVCTF